MPLSGNGESDEQVCSHHCRCHSAIESCWSKANSGCGVSTSRESSVISRRYLPAVLFLYCLIQTLEPLSQQMHHHLASELFCYRDSLYTRELKAIAFISTSMTLTEQRYAQIEKEALGFTWACECPSDYLIGVKFHIHTDHKPLVPLFSSKHLAELPARVQRFCLYIV